MTTSGVAVPALAVGGDADGTTLDDCSCSCELTIWRYTRRHSRKSIRLFFIYANNSGAAVGEQDFDVEVEMDPATAALLRAKVSAWQKAEQR